MRPARYGSEIPDLHRYLIDLARKAGGGVSVANLAALAAVPTAGLVNGTLAYVQSPKGYWNLDKTSTASPNGETVVAATVQGNWLLGNTVGAEPLVSVLAFSGIDPLGVADSSVGFQAAVTALAGTGIALFIPAGTYLFDHVVVIPSDVVIIGSPGAVIVAALGIHGSVTNAPFAMIGDVASTSSIVSLTTGTEQVMLGSEPAVGQAICITANGTGGIFFVQEVTGGAGNWTVTVDRSIPYAPIPGTDLVVFLLQTTANPTGAAEKIRLYGNGMTLTGTTDLFVTVQNGHDIIIDDLYLDASDALGTMTYGFVLDGPTTFCEVNHVRLKGAGNVTYGLCGNGERIRFQWCESFGCQTNGILLESVWFCEALECHAWGNGGAGLLLTTDGASADFTYANVSTGNRIIGGSYVNGSSSTGIQVGPSTDTQIIGVVCQDNAYGINLPDTALSLKVRNVLISCCDVRENNFGVSIDSSVLGTVIAGLDVADCIDAGIQCNGAVVAASNVQGACTGVVIVTGGEVHLSASNIGLNTSDETCLRVDGGALYASNVAMSLGAANAFAFSSSGAAGSKLVLEDVEVTLSGAPAGTFGIYAPDATTVIRLGDAVDLSATATPYSLIATTKINRAALAGATVVMNGTTPVAVAWPDLKSSDTVIPLLIAAGGTQGWPIIAQTPGTGFSIVSTNALDTSTYGWLIR